METEQAPEKLSEQLMVRVTPRMMARIEAVCARKHLKPADLGRQGVADLLERYEAETPAVDAETAGLVAQAAAMSIDIKSLLKTALAEAA